MKKEEKNKKVKGYIDRIEDDIAVMYIGDNEDFKIDIPIKFLPHNIKEDTRLTINFTIDTTSNTDTANEIQEMRKKLMNNS